jgi:hypoxanthine phosphoribosyltransferase
MTSQTTREVQRIHDRDFKLMITPEELQERTRAMASQISDDLATSDPLVLVVLNGAFMFAADLVREMSFDPEMQFARLRSYDGLESSGKIQMQLPYDDDDVPDRHILIIEDIIESGLTLHTLCEKLMQNGAASVRLATLLLKPNCLKTELKVDYVGFEIPDEFVIGYGMDYNQRGRTLQGIYRIEDEK